MEWKQLLSNHRFGQVGNESSRKDDRTEFYRDFDRLIFSAPFRRLQNKTQVFPLPGSIFVHNRLTHSLEVSSVGRSLGNDVARRLIDRHPELSDTHLSEAGSIVSAACLAHDMGNPPFGHSGEKAIATFFSERDGRQYKSQMSPAQWNDLIHYEGNANAFRLLTHQFKGRRHGGYVMTYATLASIVKYPFASKAAGDKAKFGFFESEADDYTHIASELGIPMLSASPLKFARHPLVYLVEAADDICYEVMDIEDAHKLKILSLAETQDLLLGFFEPEKQALIRKNISEAGINDDNEQVVYLRSIVINTLERACVDTFVKNEESILRGDYQGSLIQNIEPRLRTAYKKCEEISYSRIYCSKDAIDIELAGYKIISTLVDLFIHAAMNPEDTYSKLLLRRVSSQYDVVNGSVYERIMNVLDFVSGMTDIYALELYQKINGERIPII